MQPQHKILFGFGSHVVPYAGDVKRMFDSFKPHIYCKEMPGSGREELDRTSPKFNTRSGRKSIIETLRIKRAAEVDPGIEFSIKELEMVDGIRPQPTVLLLERNSPTNLSMYMTLKLRLAKDALAFQDALWSGDLDNAIKSRLRMESHILTMVDLRDGIIAEEAGKRFPEIASKKNNYTMEPEVRIMFFYGAGHYRIEKMIRERLPEGMFDIEVQKTPQLYEPPVYTYLTHEVLEGKKSAEWLANDAHREAEIRVDLEKAALFDLMNFCLGSGVENAFLLSKVGARMAEVMDTLTIEETAGVFSSLKEKPKDRTLVEDFIKEKGLLEGINQ